MLVSSVVGLHYSNILQAMLHTAQSIGSSARAGGMSENLWGGGNPRKVNEEGYASITGQNLAGSIRPFRPLSSDGSGQHHET